ncbi:MAG TPA: serine--tRNA ligase, partial [Bacteroidales bacterium]|nr:serine--tRNA ligase [Bacteroidales bacterium]
MLTLKFITDNQELVLAGLTKKGFDGNQLVADILDLDANRKRTQTELDAGLAELNTLSRSIGQLMQSGQQEAAKAARERTASLKESNKALEATLKNIEGNLQECLIQLPNLPHASVPAGRTAEDNVVERSGGHQPELPADAQPHWELAKQYDLIDFELGVKITGAGFPVYKGKGARLQRALINFFLDNAR